MAFSYTKLPNGKYKVNGIENVNDYNQLFLELYNRFDRAVMAYGYAKNGERLTVLDLENSLRSQGNVENAEKIAAFLKTNKAVKKIYYPGLPEAQGYETNRRQAKNGGAMLSFELYEKYDIRVFFKSLQLISLAESLGGVESLVCHPASMTHASIPKEIRDRVGITDGLIRLSAGIENADDLIGDIERAIDESGR